MATNKKLLGELNAAAAELGLYVAAFSPGDGRTRYRFFDLVEAESHPRQDFFGPANGVYTAVGAGDAWRFLERRGTRRPSGRRRR